MAGCEGKNTAHGAFKVVLQVEDAEVAIFTDTLANFIAKLVKFFAAL